MSEYALVENGTVANVIVADSTFIAAFVVENPHIACIDLSTVTPSPAVGWSYSAGIFTPPALPPYAPTASLVTDPSSISAGTDASTVTWTAAQLAGAPPSVTFSVNGALSTVPVNAGKAVIQVTSPNAGDTVTVQCEGLRAQVAVT